MHVSHFIADFCSSIIYICLLECRQLDLFYLSYEGLFLRTLNGHLLVSAKEYLLF